MDELMRKAGLLSESGTPGYAEGLNFPAAKDEIVAHARRRRLPKEVMDQLERLPDREYKNVSDLVTSALKGSG